MLLELSNTFMWLPRPVALSLGARHWNCWSTLNRWVTSKNFQNGVVQGDFDKHKLYPVLCDMLQKNYKNEKMNLNTREKIGLKLFFTRQIFFAWFNISLCKLIRFLISYKWGPMRLKKVALPNKICLVKNSCVAQFIHIITTTFHSVSNHLFPVLQLPCHWTQVTQHCNNVSLPLD